MSVNKSWSIDDRRLNFQFGDQAGWLIKNGKRTQLVKNPTYTGITPKFWGSCDAICGPDEWTLWGLPNCGKGEPMQLGHVGHGAAPGSLPRREGGSRTMVATLNEVDALLDRALAHSTAEHAEALVIAQDLALTRFATNRIHQNVREHDATLQVRVIDHDRIGVASTNKLDEAGIRDVVERANAIAERSAPNQRAAILPEPDGRTHDPDLGYVSRTDEATPERARHGRACRDRRRRGEGPPGVRLVLDLGHDDRRRQLARRARPASEHPGRPPDRDDGWLRLRRGVGLRARRLHRRRRARRRGARHRGGHQGRPDAWRGGPGAGRVRGHPGGVRGRGAPRVPVVHRLQRARPRGGPLVHGHRQAADGGDRQHLGRRGRSDAACRHRSTSRASSGAGST